MKKKLLILLLTIPTLFLMACNDDDEVIGAVDDEVAFVSLYHASPDAPDLRVVVDDRQINTYPFDYAENTGYLRFFTGERTISVGPYDGSNIVYDTTLTLEDDQFYSIFIADEYPEVAPLILNDNSDAPEEGMAKIRFVHLSPDAAAVALNAESLENPIVDDQSFGDPDTYHSIEAGTYDLNVSTVDGDDVVLEIPNAVFQEGWFYTVLVRGYASPPAGNNNDLTADILIN